MKEGHGSTPAWLSGLLLSKDAPDESLAAWKEALRGGAGAESLTGAGDDGEGERADEDGIFTASEVATLDLRKTLLVTVPACLSRVDLLRPESGAENLLALQRAFSVAGARQVLLTLWPVEDKAGSAEFMRDLQKKLHASGAVGQGMAGNVDIAALFQEVQREWLVRLRTGENGGLIKAVSTAGPYVMTQGVRARK